MLHSNVVSVLSVFRFCLVMCGAFAVTSSVSAQQSGEGTIQGRVLNSSTGNYLNNAQIRVVGTNLTTYSSENGDYRLTGVPTGEATVAVSMVGLSRAEQTVTVSAGKTALQDFRLTAMANSDSDEAIELEPMSVTATEMSAQAIATTAKRNAGNIKDVISIDEFVDKADGNIGEFIKFVPGLDIQYNPFSPAAVTIRGMPATGTIVQFDGVPTAPASAGNTRSFDLNTASTGNIERIEVTKASTPDQPANAVGGSINVISKSGFSRVKPLFTYNFYTTYNAMEGEFDPSFKKVAGPDGLSSKAPVQPAFDLSYILPVNKNLAFTFALTRAPRYNQVEFRSPNWNIIDQKLNQYQFNEYVSNVDLRTGKATVDWRISDKSTVQVSYHKTDRRSLTRQHTNVLNPGAGSVGDYQSIQGVNPVGVASGNLSGNQQYRSLNLGSIKYNYNGDDWKFDAYASSSTGGFTFKDIEDGFFATVASNYTGLVLGMTGLDTINDRGIPTITATKGGVTIDPFDASHNSINTVTSSASRVENTVNSFGGNLSREYNFSVPTQIKVGLYQEIMERDNIGGVKTWTFTPPGGAAAKVASNHDVLNEAFSARAPLTDVNGKAVYSHYLSSAKLYDLYLQNPSWFVLNETTAYTNMVNASTDLKETISAAYVRLDHRFFDRKLWIVYGVRFEQTEDVGHGPKNDIAATYQRDAAGNYVLNGSGKLVKITTNALANAQLQYTERGALTNTKYDGYYPSVNASYAFTERLVMRAAYGRTMGRPDLDEVVPSVVVTDPNLDVSTKRITVVDGKLQPWTSDNYDLTFEAYDIKNATVSFSLFQKNMTNFFAIEESQVTPADLVELGLPDDFSDYNIRRTRNGGTATLSGFEISYRQSLQFIPVIGDHMQVFANATTVKLSGNNPEDFAEFSPHNFNAGLTYAQGKLITKFNMTHNGEVRRSPSAASSIRPAGVYNLRGAANRYDFSAEYRFHKRFSLYYSVRNLTATPVKLQIANSETPGFLRPANYQFVPAAHTLGIKGTF